MKFTVTIKRTTVDYWSCPIDADSEGQARVAAVKQAKREAVEQFDVFSNAKSKYKIIAVQSDRKAI